VYLINVLVIENVRLKNEGQSNKQGMEMQFWLTELQFLPAQRYATMGLCDSNVSVCLSVCPSVRHEPVLCQNEES